ncbi:MAG: glycosyltransferase family 39 protein, partial [Pseudomonadota bacterium]
MARAKTSKRKNPPKKRKAPSKKAAQGARWQVYTLALLAVLLVVRLAVNAMGLVPVHFDEGQYWAYGQELDWGYYSKPPLVGGVIRVTTDLMGDTLFGLRLATPIAHTLIAWLIFLTARQLFDAMTGFWAAAGYALAPGVGVSSMIISTDPVMMVFWALALYSMAQADKTRLVWWAVMGAAIGLGMLAKYTMLAFAVGLIGWFLFTPDRRNWAGMAVTLAVAMLVFAPNLIWNAENSFATITHVAEDANPGGSLFNPGKLAEFLGAQFGVIGLIFFPAIGLALWHWRSWKPAPEMRLLAWQTVPLLAAITVLAFVTRAQPNWAVPAYVAGSILAAHWLLGAGRRVWMIWGQMVLSVVAVAAVWGIAAVYALGPDWPRAPDPFKKMRLSEPFCERALAAMSEEGAEILLSNDRRRLSECMFLGGLSWDEIGVWNPKLAPQNHHELVATIYPGDERMML